MEIPSRTSEPVNHQCSFAGAWILDGRDIPLKLLHAGKPILVWYLVGSFTAFGLALLLNPLTAQHRLETRRGFNLACLTFIFRWLRPWTSNLVGIYPLFPVVMFLAFLPVAAAC